MDKKVSEKNRDPIIKRLDVIINLMLQRIEAQDGDKEENTKRKRIKLLKDTGLSAPEIADLLGKSKGYIDSALSKIKKRKDSK